MNTAFLPLVLALASSGVFGRPYPQAALPDRVFNRENDSALPEEPGELSIGNRTIADLVQEQTDTVKKIVSDQHEQQSRVDYHSAIAKPDADFENEKVRDSLDGLSLEELKLKCQHLTRLIGSNNRADQPTDSEANQNKLSYSKVKIGNGRPISGFYITQRGTSSTSTTPRVPQSEPPPSKPLQNIKYIKLEPVILQKTILSDGRTIYYWHKSLPSTGQFNFHSQISPPISESPSTSTTTTTTSTTPASSGYDFRNFFPSFYSLRGSESIAEIATEKTTTAIATPSTTTTMATPSTTITDPSSTTDKSDELLYTQQLRFVVPVPYANVDNLGVKQPWEFDQFAYYPKQLQPQTVNVQVPYVPTFHIIKALAVPNKQEEPVKIGDDYTAFDNVSV